MYIRRYFVLPALVAAIGLLPGAVLRAQTFKTLHAFTAIRGNGFNGDGAGPRAGLILAGNTLYGTAVNGGAAGLGTVFAVNTDGSGFRTLYSFTGAADGANPRAGLLLVSNTVCGTASAGGSYGFGTVFVLKTNGTTFTPLYSFMGGTDGGNPRAGLVIQGNTLYGATQFGGGAGVGTLFAINTDGSGFMPVYSFAGADDGAQPVANLFSCSNTLYGTAYGISSTYGTVFALNTDVLTFTVLHNFAGPPQDGANPQTGLALSGDILFGTAGGGSGAGTVYTVNTDGSGFAVLHNFGGAGDGSNPLGSLILSHRVLYGTTQAGGTANSGTVFMLAVDGSGFVCLHAFTGGSDGAQPFAGLVLSSNVLYGTTMAGGSSGNGTIFSIALPPPPSLSISPAGTNVVLTWPTNATGFLLQCATNLVSPATWTSVASAPVILNGQNSVTNTGSAAARFFRLSQ